MKLQDLTRQKFGRLQPRRYLGQGRWQCTCDCGRAHTCLATNLRGGHTTSCGCFQREDLLRRRLKHGGARKKQHSREYESWTNMLKRCRNQNDPAYAHYGGRGITVCAQWQGEKGFSRFLQDMGACPCGLTLERLENDKGYSPENCAWRTRQDQMRNTRATRRLTYAGTTLSLVGWSEKMSISKQTLWRRLHLGWSVAKTLETPVIQKYSHPQE